MQNVLNLLFILFLVLIENVDAKQSGPFKIFPLSSSMNEALMASEFNNLTLKFGDEKSEYSRLIQEIGVDLKNKGVIKNVDIEFFIFDCLFLSEQDLNAKYPQFPIPYLLATQKEVQKKLVQ